MLARGRPPRRGRARRRLLDSDRNPPVFDPADPPVTLPESFKKSFRAYMDGGWGPLDMPDELGGTVVPPSLRWAIAEMVLGANPAVHMYSAGPGLRQAPVRPRRRRSRRSWPRWSPTAVGRHDGADRARRRLATSAPAAPRPSQQDDGTWHINGVKRFITSGEHDLTENIIHFVLARPEGAGPGTKGLSLFIVPKFHVDLETGELGERNGVFVTNVEHKMGLKVSATCELHLRRASSPPSAGWSATCTTASRRCSSVIEYARMMVGTKAIATLSTGYLNALEYAKKRVQGADLTQMTDKAAPRVTITHHPDVRRSLMLQKAYAEGLRALVLYTASQQDEVDQSQLATGAEELPEDSPAAMANRVNDLLLPIVKGVGSERAYVLLAPSRCRPSAAPASCRTTRSSSTSATPRSTPSTRARPRSRARTSSSARSSATRARRSRTCPRRSRSSPRPARAPRSPPSASCWARPWRTCRASWASWSAS